MRYVLILALFVTSCSAPEKLTTVNLVAFGTNIEILLWDVPAEKIPGLRRAVTKRLYAMEQTWHAWQPSALTAIDQACREQTTLHNVDTRVLALIKRAQTLYDRSDGLFNPAIGGLIALWGFHQDDPTRARPPPSNKAIGKWQHPLPTPHDIVISGDKLNCHNSKLVLDFGGFAKGDGIGEIGQFLRAQGVSNAVINAGGDLIAIGQHGARPWRVGIQSPFSHHALGTIMVKDGESVMTSGTYARQFRYQGQHYHHIIDPRTGKPAQGFVSVTVIARDATLADAGATALLIAGPSEWKKTAQKMGLTAVLLITEEGEMITSAPMKKRIHGVDALLL